MFFSWNCCDAHTDPVPRGKTKLVELTHSIFVKDGFNLPQCSTCLRQYYFLLGSYLFWTVRPDFLTKTTPGVTLRIHFNKTHMKGRKTGSTLIDTASCIRDMEWKKGPFNFMGSDSIFSFSSSFTS